jgi:hypothetical protein
MLCTFRKLNYYLSVLLTVAYSIYQTHYSGSIYFVNANTICYRHSLLCHFMLVLRPEFAGWDIKVMSLYASLLTRVVITLY